MGSFDGGVEIPGFGGVCGGPAWAGGATGEVVPLASSWRSKSCRFGVEDVPAAGGWIILLPAILTESWLSGRLYVDGAITGAGGNVLSLG